MTKKQSPTEKKSVVDTSAKNKRKLPGDTRTLLRTLKKRNPGLKD